MVAVGLEAPWQPADPLETLIRSSSGAIAGYHALRGPFESRSRVRDGKFVEREI
jgi:hypothetical protein